MQAVALLSSAIALIVLDQSAKAAVIGLLRGRQTIYLGSIAIRHVLNQQAFGGRFQNRLLLLSLIVVEIVLFVSVVQFMPVFKGALAPIALGIALGGAGSNVLDQMFRRGVVDFIDLGFWPVFNLADIAIVVGIATGIACI